MSAKKQNLLLAPDDINQLLSPEPLWMEMGLERSEEGLLTVSVRTDLHGCKGRMLEWWFTFLKPRSISAGGTRMIMWHITAGIPSGKRGKLYRGDNPRG